MAVTRAKKVAQVEKLGGELKSASSMIVATYSKLTVTQDFELRKALRPTGAKYRVVKKIESLATMPSKGELYSKLLFLLNAPSQRLVTAMNAVGRNLAVVVGQGVEQKKFKEA